VFVQMKNGAPARDAGRQGAARGQELFRGVLGWTWDPAPSTNFRYRAQIPMSALREHPSPFRVIDYLIIVADPRKIDSRQLDELEARVKTLSDPAAISAVLDSEKERLAYYDWTSWDVRVR
jgi:hypothetical protein